MRRTYLYYATTAFLLCGLALPDTALCQALPWKQSSPQSSPQPVPAQAQPVKPHRHAHRAVTSAPAPSAAGDTRTADDQMLDKLAGRFYALHEKDVHAIPKMLDLEREVGEFNESLRAKSSEADIRHDAQHLLERISRQRKEWEDRAAASTRH